MHNNSSEWLEPVRLLTLQATRAGIYGWRKRLLYVLMCAVVGLVFVNAVLTIWIMRITGFSLVGIGRLKVLNDGVRLDGKADFLQPIYLSHLHSRSYQPLEILSVENITLNSRNKAGDITSRLHIDDKSVEVLAEKFTVHSGTGQILFHTENRNSIFGVETLKITGNKLVRVRGAVQTPVVKAELYQELRLETYTRSFSVFGAQGVSLQSRSGKVKVNCMRNIALQSKNGTIYLDSEGIYFHNLKMTFPTTRGRSYPGIYQLCACENGQLFASPSTGVCQSDGPVCQLP